ncbi:hypothetical protein CHLNCDRAFT_133169 [Chlorella variabilis]|uniref:Uncharacterized protein n=1 Tax=Chlorella variabilis TaxID=554065 RepID=E1Z2I4_CHLVA|nr:hypothetical protein CHLNCDRAFT_133169 [Chlorella variabilis]EFN60005.1 hypothetical protein CHLNCDRAFT_133169 [Chlorella variabilis]|eukprot:XP_005852107.1 hypothetical protein CHLNCDRAFT_133169 [Chlorella variabilis]
MKPMRDGKSGGGNGSGVGSTIDTQLLEAAVKEPVAFLGGVFAGFLALDMQKEPLKSWLQETAAEAGLRYQATVERLEQERRARV